MNKSLTAIIVIFLALVGVVSANAAPDDISERDALMALYNSTGGPNWHRNENWGSESSLCHWHGVKCKYYWGNVYRLNLNHNNLSGTIPPELENLRALEYLSLSANNLGGPIPPELGKMGDLQFLNLSFNSLSGTIPPELENLSALGYLGLSANNFGGSIPPELGKMGDLKFLDLSFNNLTGPIPIELGDFEILLLLLLRDNDLSGVIPDTLANLQSLIGLDISENPGLSCWSTLAALVWSLGLAYYEGPTTLCESHPNLWLPFVRKDGDIMNAESIRKATVEIQGCYNAIGSVVLCREGSLGG